MNTIFDMRLLVTVLLFFFYCTAVAQQTVEGVQKAVYAYNDALETKDTVKLNQLLHENLSYGHSNGWIETRAEQITNLYNGTINYHKIDQPELQVILNGKIATVRGNGIFDVDYKGIDHMVFDLHVMQTWIWKNGRWQMLNRQSVSNKK